jgi:hypothetical protein
MAYTVGFEHLAGTVDGEPRTYTLRATQIYRREGGDWRVVHRHGDRPRLRCEMSRPGPLSGELCHRFRPRIVRIQS